MYLYNKAIEQLYNFGIGVYKICFVIVLKLFFVL